eukprot:scpid49811/ scgid24922/ 
MYEVDGKRESLKGSNQGYIKYSACTTSTEVHHPQHRQSRLALGMCTPRHEMESSAQVKQAQRAFCLTCHTTKTATITVIMAAPDSCCLLASSRLAMLQTPGSASL